MTDMGLSVRAIVFDAFETLLQNSPQLWLQTMEEISRTQRLGVAGTALWERWIQFERELRRDRVNLDKPEKSPSFRTYWEVWHDCFVLTFSHMRLAGDAGAATDAAFRALAGREPYEDASQLLKQLEDGPWRLAVLSNADDSFLLPALGHSGFAPFQTVLTSEGIRAYKPHPLTYQRLVEAVDCPAGEVVYVGDSPLEDIHGPKKYGMHAVLINRHNRGREDSLMAPDFEIRSLLELPGLLEYPQG